MKRISTLIAALAFLSTPAFADMTVQLQAPWTGKKIPAGQHCQLQGGNGSTPPMKVTNLPQGTAAILVEYDDKSYQPLSKKGGHGSLIYPVSGSSATLPSVPGMTDKLPNGVRVHKKARATGQYASKGYLPPCSGGKNNQYTATLYPIGADGKSMGKTTITIGRY